MYTFSLNIMILIDSKSDSIQLLDSVLTESCIMVLRECNVHELTILSLGPYIPGVDPKRGGGGGW